MKSIFLLLVAIALNCDAKHESSKYIKKAFDKNEITADSYIYPPEYLLKVNGNDLKKKKNGKYFDNFTLFLPKVKFPDGAEAKLGNVLEASKVAGVPFITWDAHQDCYYTLVAYNPDAMTRANPEYREFRLWLVFNIPGDRVGAGDVAEEYIAGSMQMHNASIVYQKL